MTLFDVWPWLAAFGGGLLGAALGGLNAFALCGLSAIVGTVLMRTSGDWTFDQVVTWGPVLGPHVAFAGGVAAAAFAARQGASGEDAASGENAAAGEGRDVLRPLMGADRTTVLVVGGVFGVFGHGCRTLLDAWPGPGGPFGMDSIATTVVVSGLVARLLFGSSGLLGSAVPLSGRWRPALPEAWLPWQSRPGQLLAIGAGGGLVTAYTVIAVPGSLGIVFGLSALPLLLLHMEARVPVIIHLVLAAGLTTEATGSVLWGTLAAVSASFLAEFFARLLLVGGDTHVDPPACALAVLSLLRGG